MSPPPEGALWRPVDRLADLDVPLVPGVPGVPGAPGGDGSLRVELVDRRSWVALVSLPPAEAVALAAILVARARAAGWTGLGPSPGGGGHEPGG